MTHPLLIENVHIQNFGCIKDLEMKLTPLHALIGPNDSGKSAILRAVRTAMQLVNGNFTGSLDVNEGQCIPFHPGLNDNAEINVVLENYLKYKVKIFSGEDLKESILLNSGLSNSFKRTIWQEPEGTKPFLGINPNITKEDYHRINLPENFSPKNVLWKTVEMRVRFNDLLAEMKSKFPFVELSKQKPRMVRIDPDSLRLAGGLIPQNQPITIGEKGVGLASILDALKDSRIDEYLLIRKNISDLFPTIADINVYAINNTQKGLKIKLRNGTEVQSGFISEGVLYYLAFSALQYLEPASILLVEEPENGLHPSRIKDIMTILREVSKTTQVLIATHSPLVINEMQPEEVSLIRRDPETGTSAEPMNKTKDFKERAKIYALGELWLSYADGVDEKELRGTGHNDK
jgi:predicted ATPase